MQFTTLCIKLECLLLSISVFLQNGQNEYNAAAKAWTLKFMHRQKASVFYGCENNSFSVKKAPAYPAVMVKSEMSDGDLDNFTKSKF